MLVAFRVKPIEGICENCELWKEFFTFDHIGKCKVNGSNLPYNHKCDVPE
jgi:hypothetical protein